MQLLGAVVSGLVGLFVVRNAEVVGNTAAGDSSEAYVSYSYTRYVHKCSGLALVYSLSFTDSLTFFARTYAEVRQFKYRYNYVVLTLNAFLQCQMDSNVFQRLCEYIEGDAERYFPDRESLENLSSRRDRKSVIDVASCCSQMRLSHWIEDSVNSCEESTIPSRPYYCDSSSASKKNMQYPQIQTLDEDSSRIEMDKHWPVCGEVEFRDIFMKYASSSDYVLRCV